MSINVIKYFLYNKVILLVLFLFNYFLVIYCINNMFSLNTYYKLKILKIITDPYLFFVFLNIVQ